MVQDFTRQSQRGVRNERPSVLPYCYLPPLFFLFCNLAVTLRDDSIKWRKKKIQFGISNILVCKYLLFLLEITTNYHHHQLHNTHIVWWIDNIDERNSVGLSWGRHPNSTTCPTAHRTRLKLRRLLGLGVILVRFWSILSHRTESIKLVFWKEKPNQNSIRDKTNG